MGDPPVFLLANDHLKERTYTKWESGRRKDFMKSPSSIRKNLKISNISQFIEKKQSCIVSIFQNFN